ncbi:hypothetical protein Tco_0812554 [Tanacetum coccineum]
MPEFSGLCDPIAAICRIHEMEDILKAIRCADKDKVVYALFKLRSEALSAWWDIVKLEEELLTFKRGYQTEHQVATEGRRMERFIRGLKSNILELVSTRNLSTFQEAIWAAQEKFRPPLKMLKLYVLALTVKKVLTIKEDCSIAGITPALGASVCSHFLQWMDVNCGSYLKKLIHQISSPNDQNNRRRYRQSSSKSVYHQNEISQERKKHDRVELGLPGKREDLVSAVAKAAKNPVFACFTLWYSPVDVSFAKADAKNGMVILVKLVDSLLQKLFLVIHVSFTLTFKVKPMCDLYIVGGFFYFTDSISSRGKGKSKRGEEEVRREREEKHDSVSGGRGWNLWNWNWGGGGSLGGACLPGGYGGIRT